jgi:hypothetical protein
VSGLALVVASTCAAPNTSPAPTTSPTATSVATSVATASAAPTPVDLSARPLVWFAPLPPLPTHPGRPYTGSDDFMDLFAADAPWPRSGSHVGVFKLYGEWVGYAGANAPADLRAAVAGIAQRGMILAVEAGPLDATADCGEGVESFAGSDSGRELASRIRAAGGVLQVIALDEPYYFAHLYDGPNACHWPIEKVAEEVAAFVVAVREEFPWVIVGDIEPTPAPVSPEGLGEWLGAYEAAVGEPPAFLVLDIDWGRAGWPQFAVAVRDAAAQRGVPLGMIYSGGTAGTDAAWALQAGRRAVAFETAAAGPPDHVVFQSWNDKPDRVLPETEAASFTALLLRYFEDRAALDRPLPGAETNLALGATATASVSLPGSPPGQAIDGDSDSIWNAGQGPPAWIEIDLGTAVKLREIRLLVAQDPPGETKHRVVGRATKDGTPIVLATLTGSTTGGQVLVVSVQANAPALRFVRVETSSTLSWVAWSEIEVVGRL